MFSLVGGRRWYIHSFDFCSSIGDSNEGRGATADFDSVKLRQWDQQKNEFSETVKTPGLEVELKQLALDRQERARTRNKEDRDKESKLTWIHIRGNDMLLCQASTLDLYLSILLIALSIALSLVALIWAFGMMSQIELRW